MASIINTFVIVFFGCHIFQQSKIMFHCMLISAKFYYQPLKEIFLIRFLDKKNLN